MQSFLTQAAVILMSVCSFGGLLTFKEYAVSQNVLFLVGGYCLYGLANTLFLYVIAEDGVAQTMIFASAASIVLSVVAGVLYRENLSWIHFTAAALVVSATLLMLAHNSAPSKPDIPSKPSETEEIRDV